ncbi:MAG: hypothetical protein U0795_12445 [Pirellulales bacterium]
MADIKSPKLIWIKGILFLLLGLLAFVLLVCFAPNPAVVTLHCISVWAFCRFYYFAFYVIQHYVDPTYRFAGLYSFVCYAFSRDRSC